MHIKISHLFFMLCVLQSTSVLKSCDPRNLYLSKPLQKAMKDHPDNPTVNKLAAEHTLMCATCTIAGAGCCYVSSVSSATLAQPCCALGCYACLAAPCCKAIEDLHPQTPFDIQNAMFQARIEAARTQAERSR